MPIGGTTSLEVRVDGKVDGYERAIARATSATRSYERELAKLNSDIIATEKLLNDEIARKLEAQHAAYTKVGHGMMIAGGGMLIGAGLAVKAAVDWESAWTGVEKTVDGTPEQMAQLEDGLRGLSKILPASHDEIAAVAEAAGQLGVQRQNIVGFTKVMLDMGASTTMSSDEAATSMARFMNIMQTAPDDVDRLGATIADLGNKGASTESEIVALGLRLAGAGHIAGMSEAQVLGIANALSSLGINAEAGGSAVSTMIVKWSQAVDKGGSKLQALADVAGMTSSEFADLWNSDSAAAFEALIKGLQRTKEAGGSVLDQLDSLGVTQIRQRDAMLRLAGSGDVLTQSLNNGAEAWKNNSALVEEAAKRYDTTESKLKIAKNTLDDSAISLGQSLLPVLAAVADGFANLSTAVGHLPGPLKAVLGPTAALIGLVLLLGGAYMAAIPKIAAFNAAVSSGDLTKGLQRTGNAVSGVASALMGPWGLALGVGITALTIFAAKQGAAAREIDAVKATLDEQTGAITANTQQWAIKKLSDDGVLDSARKLGLSLGDVTLAAVGNADAIARLTGVENDAKAAAVAAMEAGASDTKAKQDRVRAIQELIGGLTSETGVVQESRKQWQLEHDAQQEATGGQKDHTKAAHDGTTALKVEATAAETLTKALHTLNDALLGSRAGARDYQQTLDDSRKTLMKGVRTLNISTQAGRDNQAALDNVAESTLRWSDSLAKVDKSGRSSFKVMQQGRSDLFQTARAFGMSEAEAHAYVNRVLAIPKKWETKFSTPGSDTSKRNAGQLDDTVRKVPQKWLTRFDAETGGARAGIWALVADANRALASIHDETVNVTVNHRGGVTSSYGGRTAPDQETHAAGGPVFGRGVAGDGEHVWTSREVTAAGGHPAVAAMRQQALAQEVASTGRVFGGSAAGGGGRVVRVELIGHLTGKVDIDTGSIVGIVRGELDDADSFTQAEAGRRS